MGQALAIDQYQRIGRRQSPQGNAGRAIAAITDGGTIRITHHLWGKAHKLGHGLRSSQSNLCGGDNLHRRKAIGIELLKP